MQKKNLTISIPIKNLMQVLVGVMITKKDGT